MKRDDASARAIDEDETFTPKKYAADRVFDEVGAQILSGKIAVGAALPSEGDLSATHGVSKILVRQALHRLEAAGLVAVHHGGKTLVRDPWEEGTIEIIALFYRLAPEAMGSDAIVRSVLEKQYLQGLALVESFGRRASKQARKDLAAAIENESVRTASDLALLEAKFWMKVAEGTENRVLIAEVRFWYKLTARPKMPERASVADRAAFYVELARRLAADDNALAYYIKALSPLMRLLDAPKKK